MTTKAREYLAGAQRCERRAKKTRDANSREWEMVLARAFQVLAEAEMETAARCQVAAA
jgi:hypothetical protein